MSVIESWERLRDCWMNRLLKVVDFHLAGGRVGVGDILITHESPGLREFTGEWRAGESYFLNKYK
jgi:hypothetical protein